MEFLKDNYLRPYGTGKDFKVDIDVPKTISKNYHELSRDVAELVYVNRQGKLYLLYSGGLDSEYVLSTFLALGINVIPVIIKLNPNYNDHDVRYAFDFCESKNLKPIIVDIDFDDFVASGKILDLALEFKVGAYQLPCTFSVLEKLDGTLIMGSHGNPHMCLNEENDIWYVDEYEPIHKLLDFFKSRNLYGCPFFLVYTAEQYFSFLLDPAMKKLAEHGFRGKLGNNSTKYLVYNNGSGFNLINRKKFTGYENIEQSPIFQHPNLQFFENQGKEWWGVYAIEYFKLIKKFTDNR